MTIEVIRERCQLLEDLKHKVIQYHSTIDDCIDYMERESEKLRIALEQIE